MRIGIDIDDTLTDIKDKLTNAAKEYAISLNKNVENKNHKIVDIYNNGNIYQKLFDFSYDELKYGTELLNAGIRAYTVEENGEQPTDTTIQSDKYTVKDNMVTRVPVNTTIDEFKKVINEVLDRDGAEALIKQEAFGYYNLRSTINKVFWENSLNIEDLLIVSGAQQGIDIASKAILNINDNVIVEKPTYAGALSVFKFRRANVFEIPIDEDGINIKKFEEILKKNKIKCFYTMSYFQNPTGISYSREKKIKILELANKYDFYIIEDDYLSELIFDENIKHEPFRVLDNNDRVIYIKSFSKIFLPGIRLGYIICPKKFRESIQNSKVNTDIATSTLMQRALEMYIKEGYWIKYIDNLKSEYIKRYELMKKLIKENLSEYVTFMDPKGGLSFYLNIKDKEIKSKKLFYKLKVKGVYITPGAIFYRELNLGESYFKIGFSQVTEDEISRGINIIREGLKQWHI